MVKLILAQLAVAVTVTVYAVALERLSKITSSDDVGTDDPPRPPEESDQCEVSDPSQLPVPPTKYRVAINLQSIY